MIGKETEMVPYYKLTKLVTDELLVTGFYLKDFVFLKIQRLRSGTFLK